MTKAAFSRETDLCRLFIACLPDGWIAYPETGGFDILLVRSADGFQIGVEAKLKLNAKVIAQAMEKGRWVYTLDGFQPDCRAVLVPAGVNTDLSAVCAGLGITIIRMRNLELDADGMPRWYGRRGEMVSIGGSAYSHPFEPNLPGDDVFGDWFERAPAKRITLPDWVPDVVAGDKSPVSLTPWKVKAIKIVVTLAKRGYVTRGDFKHFKINMTLWTAPHSRWLVKDGAGGWIAGPGLPDFRKQHPVNFEQIEADFEKWQPPETATQPGLFSGAA
ncbi:hypothetical protein GCM10007989_07520 [Devosia pacifica]|uniref:Uncharacterized protein n=1 Tax=Devosia pacifica TaxID=1335967 RepID=A0A918RXX6_9HYPH|nr:hypothetical protein [Devosia pacifica]GHA15254.1 hypothetical protein GCM10007989_07520 [Devosia pacifica]